MTRINLFTIGFSLIILGFLNALFAPKYMSGAYEGALTAEYYSAPRDNDVLFVGDCEVYENFSPVTLYREYGFTSYIRGGAQQLVWQSFYALKEALRRETPKVAAFNVLALKYGEPQSEPYNRLNLDGMRFSPEKILAVNASMTPGESGLSYFLPLMRWHDRWDELTPDDVKYLFKKKKAGFNGYLMNNGVKPVDVIPRAPVLADYTLPETSMEYLAKIADLCAERGITLVLLKAPTIYPYWHDEWDAQIREFAESRDVRYVNYLDNFEVTTDTYDGGLHLNTDGAEKLTRLFGEYLNEFAQPGERSDKTLRYWEKLCDDYDALKAIQKRELSENGKITTFTRS